MIGVLVALLAFFASTNTGLVRLELASQDFLVRSSQDNAAGDPTTADFVVVIDIDDASLSRFGGWPWSRDLIADLIQILAADYGAAAIGLDVLMPEWRDDSDALVDVLQTYKVITPMAWSETRLANDNRFVNTSVVCESCDWLPQPTAWIQNHPRLLGGSVGHVTPTIDIDGVVRRMAPLVCTSENKCIEAMGLSLARQLLGVPPHYESRAASNGGVKLGLVGSSLEFLLDPQGGQLLPWASGTNRVRYISAADVLLRRLPLGELGGSIALIGSTAAGLNDLIATPVSTQMPAVEIHANLTAALLSNSLPVETLSDSASVYVALLAGVIALWLVGALFPAYWMIVAAISITSFWFLYAYVMAQHQTIMPLASVLASWYGLTLFWVFLALLQHVRRVKTLFSQFSEYVSSPVVEEARRAPDLAVRVRPQRRVVTVVYIDIQGFTALTEKLSISEIEAILATFLTLTSDVILARGGTIDKYIGDAIMAFWGAPDDQPDQAERAVRALEDIARQLPQLRQRTGIKEFNFTAGIDTGEGLVGSFGTEYRKAYTVIGATANRAAKYQASARALGGTLVIGTATWQRLNTFNRPDSAHVESCEIGGRTVDVYVVGPH